MPRETSCWLNCGSNLSHSFGNTLALDGFKADRKGRDCKWIRQLSLRRVRILERTDKISGDRGESWAA